MKMDTKKQSSSSTQGDEEDYIDIEVSTSKTPSPQTREFEFQSQITLSTTQDEKDTSPSPADELFYKGNLLPLHLPRRLQMVRKILENSAPPTITTSTPMESSNVSPTESCRVSCELHSDEYVFHWSTDLLSTNPDKYFQQQQQQQQSKKCWSKKLTLIKQVLLTQKLKASRLYFKSLFNKSTCSANESTFLDENPTRSKIKDFLNNNHNNTKYFKFGKETPFEEIVEDASTIGHRKSFSGAIKRHCSAKCISGFSSSLSSSSSSTVSSCSTTSGTLHSNKSSGFYELNLVKSCNKYSSDSEIEKAIEGAIAHCKKSQEKQCFSGYNHSFNHTLIQR